MYDTLLPNETLLMPRQASPFNGDAFAEKKFLELKQKFDISKVVELGSCVGGTTKWLCENFERVVSIEIVPEFRNICLERCKEAKNLQSLLGSTLEYLPFVLKLCSNKTIFYIDSHWMEFNEMPQELELIAQSGLKPVLAIHDMKVPNHPELQFDTYGDIVYEFEWIKDKIEKIYGVDGYVLEYNSEAEGAKVGIAYIYPKTK